MRGADTCPYCGEDWVGGETIYGCDVRLGSREAYLVFQPCCQGLADAVAEEGYEETTGVSVERVASLITGHEVLEVFERGDAGVLCRLTVQDPTEVADGVDRCGVSKARSPRGWQREVFRVVEEDHSHHERPNGWKFGIAVYNGGLLVGVAVVAPPVSRVLMQAQPHTAEVTRVCVCDVRGEMRHNAVSKLYAAVARRARSLGYDRLITYTLEEESGHSLLASGWARTGSSQGGEWGRPSRSRATKDSKSDITVAKVRWEKGLSKRARKRVAQAAEGKR